MIARAALGLFAVFALATTLCGAEPPPPRIRPGPPPKPVDPKEIAAAPEKYLYLTAANTSLGEVPGRGDEALQHFLKTHPNDPLSLLLKQDRTVIGKLIPFLNDTTPLQSFNAGPGIDRDDRPPPIPGLDRDDRRPLRFGPCVGDLALAIVDYHSKCQFAGGDSEGFIIRALPQETREKAAKRVAEWWPANKDKPVAAGIRAAIPGSYYDAKIVMARRLFRLGDEDDKRYARTVLLEIFREYRGHRPSATTAFALAECGDFTPRDEIYELWHACLDKPGSCLYDGQLLWYLCDHGRRREWDLLYALAVEEMREQQRPGAPTRVCEAVTYRTSYVKNLYAIPFLGMGLTQTENRGVRGVGDPVVWQHYSRADEAVELLQSYTGMDFGYKRVGTQEERTAAIKKAQMWWEKEGKAKYTLDYIEKNLVKKPDPKK